LIVLRDVHDIDTLVSELRWWSMRDGEIRVEYPQFTEAYAARLSKRLTSDWAACGCEVGGLFTLIALAVVVTRVVSADGISLADISQMVAIVFASALAGKIVGLLGAYARLRYRIRCLRLRLTAPDHALAELGS